MSNSKEYYREYYQKHKAKKLEYLRHYHEKHMEEVKEYHKRYYQTHRENWVKANAERTLRYSRDPIFRDKRLKERQDAYDRKRAKVLTHYGNGMCACVQCGFSDVRALNIDHIKEVGTKNGKKLVADRLIYYLFNNNYPSGYQTLCSNCNTIKEHTRRRQNGLII